MEGREQVQCCMCVCVCGGCSQFRSVNSYTKRNCSLLIVHSLERLQDATNQEKRVTNV